MGGIGLFDPVLFNPCQRYKPFLVPDRCVGRIGRGIEGKNRVIWCG